MPFCEVGTYQNADGATASGTNGTKIFYRTYGNGPIKVLLIIGKQKQWKTAHSSFWVSLNFVGLWWSFRDDPQILPSEFWTEISDWSFLDESSGLAGTHDSWGPQIKGLAGTVRPNDEDSPADDPSGGGGAAGVEVCAFDNRGMGRSSVPTKKSEYTWVLIRLPIWHFLH